MKRFAVRYFNHYDNELTVKIVEATDWRDSIAKHEGAVGHDPASLPDDLEKVKEEYFNQDTAIDVVEIP